MEEKIVVSKIVCNVYENGEAEVTMSGDLEDIAFLIAKMIDNINSSDEQIKATIFNLYFEQAQQYFKEKRENE